MAGQDANALVQLPDEPNVLADRTPISEAWRSRRRTVNGSLDARPRRSCIDLIGGFLPVGFYYKAFYKPLGAWKRWEPLIRRQAGLGRVNLDAHHGYYDKAYAFADVLVIGGGPAGIAAALEAAQGRRRGDSGRGGRRARRLALPMPASPPMPADARSLREHLVCRGRLAAECDHPHRRARRKASSPTTGSR